MSHHGITLVFTPGDHGRPEVMTLRDVEAHCPACGKEEHQRSYGATPWHTLTTSRLARLLEEVPSTFASRCPQCDEPTDGRHVVRWMLHYGFPGLRGLLTGFAAAEEGWRRWLLQPWEKVDAQLVPRWDVADDSANVEVERLDEAAVQRAFGRAFSGKEACRRWIAAGSAAPLLVAPGLAAVVADGAEAAAAVAIAAGVAEPVVESLATGGVARGGFFGAPSGWLAGLDLSAGNVWGVADTARVAPALEHVLRSWPVETALVEVDGGLRLRLPSTPDPARWPRLDARGIAIEAARSLVPVEEAAHAELDRALHFLTGLYGDEYADRPGGEA
jgi:hypothetical protein